MKMPSDAAEESEEHALGEELTHQSAAACSHRQADRHLLLPCR